MLDKSELLLYSRHIILPEIDLEGQERLKNSHVVIVGLGGLGSPAALYLAAAGVGRLTLIDDDEVEASNLQRQVLHSTKTIGSNKTESAKAGIHALSPGTLLNIIPQRANIEVLDSLEGHVDAVLDCTDNFGTRFLINEWSSKHQIPLISATAVAFSGQLAVFNRRRGDACYQCLYSNLDLPEGNCEDQGILSPVVGTMGTLQATETLKILLKLDKASSSFMLKYESLSTNFQRFSIAKDPKCSVCS